MKLIWIFTCIIMSVTVVAQDLTLKVWPDGAPDDNGMKLPEEKYNGVRVRNVSEAEM
ncbi:hypothetical protein MNBD_BACTEROID01-2507, partial [hydrothermal vent metagenome]